MMPGKPVADAVFADLEPRVAALRAGGRNPGLGTILVGNESASAGYIRMKQDRAASLGFGGRHVHLDDDASQADLVAAIRDFNTDDEVDAVLIQHPIPPHLDYEAALTELDPDKDADGAPILQRRRAPTNKKILLLHSVSKDISDWMLRSASLRGTGVPWLVSPFHVGCRQRESNNPIHARASDAPMRPLDSGVGI